MSEPNSSAAPCMDFTNVISADSMSQCKNDNTKTQPIPCHVFKNGFACKTMERWALHEEIMVWVNTFLFQPYVHVTMKDDEIFHIRNATSNHTVYYAQKMVVRLTREKSSVAPREKTKNSIFREQSLLISKMQPISFILVVPVDSVL